ncbi:hypothetical protein Gxy13693_063_001 [Komagataeibacter xylinus NBRC 13693]|uniref:GmrSD restriction endonucleases N-terminal domain-containing protein n=1 Tax=Komagataeibacter xylinus NBRC 13693 TaxID=1234668 RepID=A0A0D6QD77_KOMXY|nr:DUF262 domain-containing protein [Komagataeibacter xylinus]GAO00787.1 hypothetical protein Gxy13693_063_001 [Komagataeibacter xylinus NBRC 13693]
MSINRSLSLYDLLGTQDFIIRIPVAQRDYAQGREGEQSRRRYFLHAIKDALLAGPGGLPLDLDFIYGSRNGSAFFSVLDGQQRLTTLFLLHWYLALKEGEGADFRSRFAPSGTSRLTYHTRESARLFFDAMVRDDVLRTLWAGPAAGTGMADHIRDQTWFHLAWKDDPTVAGCLTMLDALHASLGPCGPGLYERLTGRNGQGACVTFQFLDIGAFRLTDDLYIRMNARGRILSAFENFKAGLCGHLGVNPAGDDRFMHKMDTQWADLFWDRARLGGAHTDEYNRLYLRFFMLMAFYRACETGAASFDRLPGDAQAYIRQLRTADDYNPPITLKNFSLFDGTTLQRITRLLDYCVHHPAFAHAPAGGDGAAILPEALAPRAGYEAQAQLYALTSYIHAGGDPVDNQQAYRRWQRVVNNLVNNHTIDDVPPFIRICSRLGEMAKNHEDLYGWMAARPGADSMPDRKSAVPDQWHEECCKAWLIHTDPAWEAAITACEQHDYLRGRIWAVLEQSWPESARYPDRTQFVRNTALFHALLGPAILSCPRYLLQRALLTLGDYTAGKDNLCGPKHRDYSERSQNWLGVINRRDSKWQHDRSQGEGLFATLVRSVDLLLPVTPGAILVRDVKRALAAIIRKDMKAMTNRRETYHGYPLPQYWWNLMISCPQVFRYCRQHRIGRNYWEHNNTDRTNHCNPDIYLISKTTYGSRHVELRTYVLYQCLKRRRHLFGVLAKLNCTPVSGHGVYPSLDMMFSDGHTCHVTYRHGRFVAVSGPGRKEHVAFPSMVRAILEAYVPPECLEDNSASEIQ